MPLARSTARRRRSPPSRFVLWAFALALLLKSAVPLLAAVAAGAQGRAVAEICHVYGVDTRRVGALHGAMLAAIAAPASAHAHHHDDASPAPAHVHAHAHGSETVAAATHAHGHETVAAATHAHGVAAMDHAGDPSPSPSPHGAKAGDHCVLTGMVALAGSDAAPIAPPAPAAAFATPTAFDSAAGLDAAARWAVLVGHGPPAAA